MSARSGDRRCPRWTGCLHGGGCSRPGELVTVGERTSCGAVLSGETQPLRAPIRSQAHQMIAEASRQGGGLLCLSMPRARLRAAQPACARCRPSGWRRRVRSRSGQGYWPAAPRCHWRLKAAEAAACMASSSCRSARWLARRRRAELTGGFGLGGNKARKREPERTPCTPWRASGGAQNCRWQQRGA